MVERPLCIYQHGFRRGFSTETCVTTFVQKLEYSVIKEDFVLAIFGDLEGAYDKASYAIIHKTLREWGFPPLFIKWFMFYLNNRTISITHKGITIKRKCHRGVSQGSCLSPLIFALVMDSLLTMFDFDLGDLPITDEAGRQLQRGKRRQKKDRPVTQGKVYTSGFADDTCFYICGKDLIAMQEQMQVVIRTRQEF